MGALGHFSAPTRAWFESVFPAPTAAQDGAWEAIRSGRDTLVIAPTGSGKTLSAFLWSLDRLASAPPPDDRGHRCRVLYISPMKALAVDVERNLRAPLVGIRQAAARLNVPSPDIRVAIRSGDTPAAERRAFSAAPPDIFITTPESLFLVLTSAARASLRGVETVIVDEVHALAGSKRGAHLALSLERLDALLERPAQRIGLSATVRPVDEVAQLLGGSRDVTVVQPPLGKDLTIEVVVPVQDMGDLDAGGPPPPVRGGSAASPAPRASIWPAVEERIVDLIESHRSTIVFANSRRLAERLTSRLNEIAAVRDADAGAHDRVIARAHHGSVSREQRGAIEEELKAGRLPAVVATSSLELGIDMGAVDLVVQVESPPSVASGLQRVGRAGHQVGAVSHGVILPKYRGDLVQCAVVAEQMLAGRIEPTLYPRNPLDVLAQQVVAMCAMDTWTVAELGAVIRRAAPFAGLTQSVFEAVLDMLSGRYPSDEFAELRPRITWDRVTGVLAGRPGAQRLAVTSGGTIPDRGMFGVFLVGETLSRVGELDEEMVYESRVGEVFLLGSSAWRIEDITHDRVLVTPAPGQPGKMPFWKGDALGRPAELGRALGAFLRELSRLDDGAGRARLQAIGLDELATRNLMAYLAEQRLVTGVLPDDRTIVVERFRDELGDWRLAIHSVFGAQVNQPWALALSARLRERYGVEVHAMHADDGIVLRLPEMQDAPESALSLFEPAEIEPAVQAEVAGSALFASRFRECAARALLLPRRHPGRRSPLWQQRQKSAQLLQVAATYGSFPIVLETMREVLQDVFDVPGLVALMADVQARAVRLVEVETAAPSPFAQSLLFGYLGAFMYDGDAPLADRRAQALSLDPTLLAELLGQAELRELIDPGALAEVEAQLQHLTAERRVGDAEGVADLLRVLGDLSIQEVQARGGTPQLLTLLVDTRRAIPVRIAGEQRWLAIADAGRVRDALGVPLPVGVPDAFVEPVRDPVGDLVARYARTHGPFHATQVATRLGLGVAVVDATLARLAATGRLAHGEFRPGGDGLEWCDIEVLRSLRRRSLAKLRAEVEPVPAASLARFLPQWQGTDGGAGRGADALLRALEQLQGAVVPASALESLVLPARVVDYAPALLDDLTASGEVLWAGHGALPGRDGWVSLHLADAVELLPAPADAALAPLHRSVLDALEGGHALFFRSLSQRLGSVDDAALSAAIWDLVWAGYLTNDTLGPLRTLLSSGRTTHAARRPPPRQRSRYGRPTLPSRLGPPTVAGRWSLLPQPGADPTRRVHALTEALLDRHGVVTRGAVAAERAPGGFAAVYAVLKALEEAGRVRRGYFVEGLGAAQFAVPGAVDRLRATAGAGAIVLAATDPANPYGAALAWPPSGSGHRPGRKAGALVVLFDGTLVLYVESGGRSVLSFGEADDAGIAPAAEALALAARTGALGRLTVERANGKPVLTSPLGSVLEAAGFRATPRGLRLPG